MRSLLPPTPSPERRTALLLPHEPLLSSARSLHPHCCRAPRCCPAVPALLQRDKVYAERRRALVAPDLTPLMVEYAEKTIDDILEVCVFWV